MEIKKFSEGSALTVALSGRLDAVTALELDKNLSASLGGVDDLTIDLADLEYISSGRDENKKCPRQRPRSFGYDRLFKSSDFCRRQEDKIFSELLRWRDD